MADATRRYRARLTTPTAVYWTPAVEAGGMYQALQRCCAALAGMPGMPRAAAALAAREAGWHLVVVPEESWPALEQELELLLGDSPS